MADTETVRGEKATAATNGLNTYGTQFYKNDLSKLVEFPLTPTKNNIEALQKHGIKVPEQVKVMGCDDRELSKWFVPKLTTIRTSMRKQGELAGEIMIQMLKDGSEGQLMKLPCAIVERESTKG